MSQIGDDEMVQLPPPVRFALLQLEAYYRERAEVHRWLESKVGRKAQAASTCSEPVATTCSEL